MNNIKIATAPNSWGIWFPNSEKQIPWNICLDEIAQLGFKYLELGPYGYLPSDPNKLKDELNKRQIKLCAGTSCHSLINDHHNFQNQAEDIATSMNKFSSDLFIFMDGTARNLKNDDTQIWRTLINNLKEETMIIKDLGMIPAFHPHVSTLIETEEEIIRILEEIPDLSLCFDIVHHGITGADIFQFTKKYIDRFVCLHLKNMSRIITLGMDEEEKDNLFLYGGAIRELDNGLINIKMYLKLLKKLDFKGYAIIEQDMFGCPFDKPLESNEKNLNCLKKWL